MFSCRTICRAPRRARALARQDSHAATLAGFRGVSAKLFVCVPHSVGCSSRTGEPGAHLEDLRWYMASYASVKAGELSQIHRDYATSRPYYLAFFNLVQEDDPLWSRMRGLINPMLSYYWVNAWRELGMTAANPSLSTTSPAEIAVNAATHENTDLCRLWFAMTHSLAEANPGLLRRIANQIRLNRSDSLLNVQVADTIEQMLMA